MFKARQAERARILARLENLAQKLKLQYNRARGVAISVYPAPAAVDSYIVEYARGRVSRRVTVDAATVRRLLIGPADPPLVRDLRSALQAVLARTREEERQT